jgi:hypothetical protein
MLNVTAPTDWKTLRQRGLLTVLDPLVFRAADAFVPRSAGSRGRAAMEGD